MRPVGIVGGFLWAVVVVIAMLGCSSPSRDIDVLFKVSQDSSTPIEEVEVMRHFLLSATDLTSNSDGTSPNTELSEMSGSDGTATLTLPRGKYTKLTTQKEDHMANLYFFSVANEEPAPGQDRYTQDITNHPIISGPSTGDSPFCEVFKGVSSDSETGWIRVINSASSFKASDTLTITKVNGPTDVASAEDLLDANTAPGSFPYIDVYEAHLGGHAAAHFNTLVPIDSTLDENQEVYTQFDVTLNGVTQRVQVRKCRIGYVTTVLF